MSKMGAATGLAFLLSVANFALLISSIAIDSTVRIALSLGTLAVPVVLVVAALVTLVRPRSGAGSAAIAISALAATAHVAWFWALMLSADVSDGFIAPNRFIDLAWVYFLVAAISFGVVIAILLSTLRRRTLVPRNAHVLIVLLVAVFGSPLVIVSLIFPATLPLASVALFVVALARGPRSLRRGRGTTKVEADAPSVVRRARTWAAVSLAAAVVVWIPCLAVSIASAGTQAATTALGVGLAAVQLAVIPLMVSVSVILVRPVTTLVWGGVATAAVIVAAASIVYLVNLDPASGASVPLLVTMGAGVGLWAATVAWTLLPFTGLTRAAACLVVLLAITAGYFGFVAISAGIWLAILSAIIAIGGRRIIPGGKLSPKPLPVSA